MRSAYRLALLAAAMLPASLAHAEYWIGNGATANWTTTSNWSATSGGVTNNTLPPTDDTVNFSLADAIARTITFDYIPGTTPTYSSINLNQTGTGPLTLQLLNTASFTTNSMTLGINGHGSFFMNANSIHINNYLNLGQNSPGSGTFTIAGGTLLAGSADIHVGVSGTGTFNHNAGSVYASSLSVGSVTGSSGTYTQGNQYSSLSVTYTEIIGGGTSGIFTQNLGFHSCGGLTLAANGTFNLAGGTFNSGYTTLSSDDYIGDNGTATFNQTGGTHYVGQYSTSGRTLYVGAEGGTGTYILHGGSLNVTGDIVVGNHISGTTSKGTFTLSGGYAAVSGGLTVSDLGVVTMSAGGLTAAHIDNYGSFTHTGGIIGDAATLFTNFATFNAAGSTGVFLGQFVNYGSFTADDSYVIGNGFTNYTSLVIYSGHSFTVNGSALDNEQQLSLYGGTLNLGAGLLNNASASLSGSLTGNGALVNNGLLSLGGALTLNNSGLSTNNGNFTVGSGLTLRLNNSAFTNNASFSLAGGIIAGTKAFTNGTTGTLSGSGFISTPFANLGTLYLESGALNIANAFTNAGTLQLAGNTATLFGGAITNTGTLEGFGSVGSDLANAGEIAPVAGTLIVNGALTNTGLLSAQAGAKLLARNFPANSGVISLTGGTFDTAGHTLTNNGQISGYGSLNTGGLTNAGSISITGATSTITGDLTNNAGHKVEVLYNPAIFTGHVTNNGLFKSTKTTITFTGLYTENGTFFSDPSTQIFSDVSIGTNGAWIGSTGDKFVVTGNFSSHSTANTTWNTDAAELDFQAGTSHTMSLNGLDLGRSYAGYSNNFSWGLLSLAASQTLTFQNDSENSTAALYLHELSLAGGLAQLAALSGTSDLTLYYDPSLAANNYLNDATYTLTGGATLTPIPEPSTLALTLLAATPTLLLRRRKNSRT